MTFYKSLGNLLVSTDTHDQLCAQCGEPIGGDWVVVDFPRDKFVIHRACNRRLTEHKNELVPFYHIQRGPNGWFEQDAESARARATSELEHLEDGETIIIERHDVPRFVAESIKKLTEDNA